MAFTSFNSSDFNYFTGNRTLAEKKLLRKKMRDLEEDLYNSIPRYFKKYLEMPRVGKIYEDSISVWFCLHLKHSAKAERPNFNFDISKNGIRYCLNSETISAINIFKNAVINNKRSFYRLAKAIYKGRIWLYERYLEFDNQGVYTRRQRNWRIIKEGNYTPITSI